MQCDAESPRRVDAEDADGSGGVVLGTSSANLHMPMASTAVCGATEQITLVVGYLVVELNPPGIAVTPSVWAGWSPYSAPAHATYGPSGTTQRRMALSPQRSPRNLRRWGEPSPTPLSINPILCGVLRPLHGGFVVVTY